MNRRQLLLGAGVGTGLVAGGAGLGYLLEPDCPRPDDGEALSHRARRFVHGTREAHLRGNPFVGDHGPIVVVDDGEAVGLDLDAHPPSARSFVAETDYDDAFVLAIAVMSRPGDDHRFTGVERVAGDVVHTYSCTTNPIPEDVGVGLYWLVRVDDAFEPVEARHTHATGEDERSVEVDLGDG